MTQLQCNRRSFAIIILFFCIEQLVIRVSKGHMELRFPVICAAFMLCAWPTNGTIKVGGPDGAQKLTFKAPNLSEEDSHSLFVPEEFKCDACMVVAYQV